MGCFDVDVKVLLQETSGTGGIHGFCQEPPELLLAIGAWPPALVLMELHRITEYLRLENTFNILRSNRKS